MASPTAALADMADTDKPQQPETPSWELAWVRTFVTRTTDEIFSLPSLKLIKTLMTTLKYLVN